MTKAGRITDPTIMRAVLGYCAEKRLTCWVLHTPPESTIGGISMALIDIIDDTATVQFASGDVRRVPVAELHMRTQD